MLTLVLTGLIWSTQGQTEIIFGNEDLTEDDELRQAQTEMVFMDEQASKTLIGTYFEEEMRDGSLQEAMDKLNRLKDVKVEHLPKIGAFILTFMNEAHRLERSEDLLDMSISWKESHKMEMPNMENGPPFKISSSQTLLPRTNSIPPNDGRFNELWAFQNLANNADINMQEGWQEYVGHSGSLSDVIVAVLDTGIDYTHNDLKDMMWKNPGEIAGNGIDDDNNGVIDDVYGADFSGLNAPGDPMDGTWKGGHGTHVAGIIAAKVNNGFGVAGVASYAAGKVRYFMSILFQVND